MKLASCDNCAHRQESIEGSTQALRVLNATCGLGKAPEPGEFLCPRYAMSASFHEEILALARKEFQKDVDQAMLRISVIRAERNQAFAG